MKSRLNIFFYGLIAVTIGLTACGGSGSGGSSPIAVNFAAQPPNSLAPGTSATLAANVINDSSSAGVMWTVSCGSGRCGSFNPASTASGAATTFKAPTAAPAGNTVTVTATSVADTTKSASVVISITGQSQAILGNGTFVYHLQGEDVNAGGSPYYVAGAFIVQNGIITGGEQDSVDAMVGTTATLIASNCSLDVTADGNLSIVLATNNSNIGVNGVETLRGSKVSSSRVLISEFDSFASASGSLDLQTGKSTPSGGYAFNLSGLDGTGSANALVMGGILNFSNGALSVSNAVLDYNDGGSVGQAQNFASGSVSAPDSFGRVTINLTPSTTSGVPQLGMSGYVIGANRIELIEDLPDALNGVLGGTALGQGSNTGKFSAASVAGNTYVYTAVSDDSNGVGTFAGGFAMNSNGSVSGNLAVNDLTVFQGSPITSGNWTISPSGRVTIANVTTSFGSPFAFQLYLDGNGNALELGVDNIQASAGIAYLQSSGAVNSGAYALSAAGFSNLSNLPVWSAVGPVNIDSALDWSGFTDYNALGTNQFTKVALTATTSTAQGLFAITGLDITNQNADNWGYYPIDGYRAIAIEVDGNQLGALLLEAVGH